MPATKRSPLLVRAGLPGRGLGPCLYRPVLPAPFGRMTDRTPLGGGLAGPARPACRDGGDGPGPAGGRLADGTTYDALALAHDDLSGQAGASRSASPGQSWRRSTWGARTCPSCA